MAKWLAVIVLSGCSFIGVHSPRGPGDCQSRALPVIDTVIATASVVTIMASVATHLGGGFIGDAFVFVPVIPTVLFGASAGYGFSKTGCGTSDRPADGAFGGACRIGPATLCDAGLTCENDVCVLDP
jgi:hypothetical protein